MGGFLGACLGVLADNGTLSCSMGSGALEAAETIGELSPRMSTGAAFAPLLLAVVGRGVLASPTPSGARIGGAFLASGFSFAIATGPAALGPSGASSAGFASAFKGAGPELGGVPLGGGFVLGGAPTGFARAAPPGGGPADGGRAAPRILATDALGAAPVGGGPLGGGSVDLARNAAAADVVPCGGGLDGGGRAFFFLASASAASYNRDERNQPLGPNIQNTRSANVP